MKTKQILSITSGFILLGLVATLWAGLFRQHGSSSNTQTIIPEIQREQAVREVEVSIWETANAIFYYMVEPSAMSLEEYRKQLLDVKQFMGIYDGLVTEGPELQMITEFNQRWQTSVSRAENLIPLRDQVQSASNSLWDDIHDLAQLLQNESLLVISGTPSQIQTKKLLLQECATHLWEVTSCLSFCMHATASENKTHFKAHEEMVASVLERYQAQGLSDEEKEFISSFQQQWNDYLKQLHQRLNLDQELKRQALSFWESMHEVDDVIDFEMQEEFKSRLNTRLGVNSF